VAKEPKPRVSPRNTKAGGEKTDDAVEMLREQNAALREEIDQALNRIHELEDANRQVSDRIDWVIDWLQGLQDTKKSK